jgi:ABC-2 type transport system permease protein
MLVVVIAVIAVPAFVESGSDTRDVGFTGDVPSGLPRATTDQGDGVDVSIRVHRYDDVTVGERAVRDEDVDVLVVDARRLTWRGEPDERLRAVVTGAIQLVAVQQRAAALGISPEQLAVLTVPEPVENEELGIAAGRSPGDDAAAYVMSILLLAAVALYGQLVLTAVAQEKSSRVVEVLLVRMPARNLLAGKVAGIGLLGFGQFAAVALAALAATVAVESIDIEATSGEVLAWVVAWFVLGYVMYAMAYGAFGSLASRTEDASSLAAPATSALIVGYWAAFIAVSGDPEGGWAQIVSQFPATAPFAMPARIALGATDWWEPVVAVVIAITAIAGLVAFAGRVYTGAILHGGATVKLRDAWSRGSAAAPVPGAIAVSPAAAGTSTDRMTGAVLIGAAAVVGAVVFGLARDVIWALAVGLAGYAVASRVAKGRWRRPTGGHGPG